MHSNNFLAFTNHSSPDAVLDLSVRRPSVFPFHGINRYGSSGNLQEMRDAFGLDLCQNKSSGQIAIPPRPICSPNTRYTAVVSVLHNSSFDDKSQSPTPSYSGSPIHHGSPPSMPFDCISKTDKPQSPSQNTTGFTNHQGSPPFTPFAYFPKAEKPGSPTPSNTGSSCYQGSPPFTPFVCFTKSGKPTRPFKAYPKDPISLVRAINDGITGSERDSYLEYRKNMLSVFRSGDTKNNQNMRRPVQSNSPTQQPSSSMDSSKDSAYWEKRRKNNEAAKRSRDARRNKEDEIAVLAGWLCGEYHELKVENERLRQELFLALSSKH